MGLEGLNFRNLPGAVSLQKAESWNSPGSWNAANIIVSDKSVAAEGGDCLMFSIQVGSLLNVALILGTVLVSAALLIWVERRFLGFFNDRLGPNRVGPFGILQSVADVIKLITKEDWTPPFADKLTFVVAPIIIPIVMLLSFAMIPFAPDVGIIDMNIGLLFVMAMAGLASYSAMLGGLASNNKFSLLGGLRAAGQMISYEVFMGISILGVVILSDSFFSARHS